MLYTIFSVLLFSLSFSNPIFLYGIQGLSAIALVPLFYMLSKEKSILKVYRLGALFGLLSTFITYYWLKNFGEFSAPILIGVSLGYAIEYGILFVLIWRIIQWQSNLFRPLLIAIFWTGYEYIKSIGFLGFPWALLAHSVHEISPLIQVAKITGTWGISFLLAYINAFIFEYILSRYIHPIHSTHKRNFYKISLQGSILRGHAMILVVLVALAFSYGSLQLIKAKKIIPSSYLNAILIQQNFDSWGNISRADSLSDILALTNKSLATSQQAGNPKPDVIIFSETSLRVPYQLDAHPYYREFYSTTPAKEPFLDFIKRNDTYILSGSPLVALERASDSYNAAVLIRPDTSVGGQYGKNQLVPFAELIPLYDKEFVRKFVARTLGLNGSWARYGSFDLISLPVKNTNTTSINKTRTKGTNSSVFSADAQDTQDTQSLDGSLSASEATHIIKIGTPICFEDSFSYVSRNFALNGADLLINITNVSWSKTKVAQVQQLIASKFRSIETGLTLVRSTNSGVTSVINPWGKVLAEIPMFESNYLYYRIPIYRHAPTPFVLLGDIIGKIAVLISVIYAIYVLYMSYNLTPLFLSNTPLQATRKQNKVIKKSSVKKIKKKTKKKTKK